MKPTRIAVIVAVVLAGVLLGCGGDKKDSSSGAARRGDLIGGTWVRPIRGQDARFEGMRFDEEHVFGLLGIHSMHGLEWRIEEDTLVVSTNTGRYPEPQESRLIIDVLDDKTLTLSGKNYLAGTYQRNDEASERVTGTLSYRQRIALPADAVVHLTLKSTVGGFLAAHAIPTQGRQVPIPFRICFLKSDVVPGHTYKLEATVVADGERLFHVPDGVPVITQGNPLDVQITMAPFSDTNTEEQEPSGEKPQTFWIDGMFTYMADAGLFTECRTGERFPVAQKAENAALEREYLSKRTEPAEPLYVAIEGHLGLEPAMEGDGEIQAIIVDRVLEVSAEARCADDHTATLENTHWELVAIDGNPVAAAVRQKPPYLRINRENGRVIGFGGCNSFFGSVVADGAALEFKKVGATMMACADEMETETAYLGALDLTTGYDLVGDTLTLKTGERNLAIFEARYFK